MTKSFLRACGSDGPLQLHLSGPNPNEWGVRLLQQPFAIIGRDQRADIVLDHKLASKRHVYLQMIHGEVFWIDLESRSGTWSDGQPQKFGWLTPGKTIRVALFGIQRLKGKEAVTDHPSSSTTPRLSPFIARSFGDQSLPEVTLEFLNGPSQTASWPMNRVMSLIGSAEGNKFRLADPSVSPFHCSLLRTPVGVWVIDLFGSEGISVNDGCVRFAPLADGDILRVGRYRIRVRSCFAPKTASTPSRADHGYHWNAPSRSLDPQSSIPAHPNLDVPSAGLCMSESTFWSPDTSANPRPVAHTRELSRIPWIGSEAGDPLIIQNENVTESVLIPLVNQFGSMQQQMLDQFQQAISMLVQMFGTLHRDQMSVIREELDELRKITKEFHELKHELASRSVSHTATQPTASFTSPKPATLPRFPEPWQEQNEPWNGDSSEAQVSSIRSETPPVSRSESKQLASGEPEGSVMSKMTTGQTAANAKLTTQPPPSAQSQVGNVGTDSNRDLVVWLHERMITLQRERESRWQRILRLLPGVS